MTVRNCAFLILAIAIMGGCVVLPSPDMLRDEYTVGAHVGCIRAMVALSGERPTPAEQQSITQFCTLMARDALRIYDADKVEDPGGESL